MIFLLSENIFKNDNGFQNLTINLDEKNLDVNRVIKLIIEKFGEITAGKRNRNIIN